MQLISSAFGDSGVHTVQLVILVTLAIFLQEGILSSLSKFCDSHLRLGNETNTP